MRWFLSLVVGSLLTVLSGVSWAQSEVRVFAAELLRLESRQMLNPSEVLRYADGDDGAALQKLLDPQRASRVVAAYVPTTLASGEPEPDLFALLKPLLSRYEKAFASRPRDYEDEYLDALNWSVLILLRSSAAMKELPAQNGLNPGSATVDVKGMLDAVNGLMDSVKRLLARAIREKIEAGVFSPEGAKRALGYAQLLVPPVETQAPRFEWRTRGVASGEMVYGNQCAACHISGVAGAPRLRDTAAWLPRIRSGLPSLVESTLKGKGAMAPQRGGDYLDFEIARAVVYMANAAGGKFVEPAFPVGQPESIRYRVRIDPAEARRDPVVPYAAMDPGARFKFGEKVYAANCVACHQHSGKGAGPIPSLLSAKSLDDNVSAIILMLNGSSNGTMPSWKQLSDDEIASVINYMRTTFGSNLVEHVTPILVRALR